MDQAAHVDYATVEDFLREITPERVFTLFYHTRDIRGKDFRLTAYDYPRRLHMSCDAHDAISVRSFVSAVSSLYRINTGEALIDRNNIVHEFFGYGQKPNDDSMAAWVWAITQQRNLIIDFQYFTVSRDSGLQDLPFLDVGNVVVRSNGALHSFVVAFPTWQAEKAKVELLGKPCNSLDEHIDFLEAMH